MHLFKLLFRVNDLSYFVLDCDTFISLKRFEVFDVTLNYRSGKLIDLFAVFFIILIYILSILFKVECYISFNCVLPFS